ncbi:MAG TPA: serine protease [Chitinophagaceae bacterium]|nr:serine protease [Chitinophagaceae bacterium]
MEDIVLLDVIERYLTGQMSPEEKTWFKELREKTPEIDQMVVEHKLFLHQLDEYAVHSALKHTITSAHENLLQKGDIYEGGEKTTKGRVIQLFHKYKKITAIAAGIAGVTALTISILVAALSPNINKRDYQQLVNVINSVKDDYRRTNARLNEVDSKIPKGVTAKTSGTAFLIDGKGYLVTNAHVFRGSNSAVVKSNKGQEFSTRIICVDESKDLAILKIDDADYKNISSLPYQVKKPVAELGDELFTLGYSRLPVEDVVYSMGYLSSLSGFNGDSASCQISLNANPGNSGGPVFNRNGDIVGILTAKDPTSEGTVFAINSKSIYQMINDRKESDTTLQKIRIANNSELKGMSRNEQIKQVEDYVFLVKAYNK